MIFYYVYTFRIQHILKNSITWICCKHGCLAKGETWVESFNYLDTFVVINENHIHGPDDIIYRERV